MRSPLYKAIKREMTHQLANGRWRPGEPLPPEPRLAERFGVSIGTLRKAMDELVAERIVVRRQGAGTFVTTHGQTRLFFDFFRIVPREGAAEFPDTRTLEFRSDHATEFEASELGLQVNDGILRIRNLRLLAGKPIIVDDLVLAKRLFPGLTEQVFTRRENTIYNLYQTRYGMNVLRTTDRLHAVAATPNISDLLGVKRGTPLLEIVRVAFTYNNIAIELRRSTVNSKSYDYISELD